MVERNLAKVEVASSRLVSRSSIPGKAKLRRRLADRLAEAKTPNVRFPFLILVSGGVAEWSCSGLQSRVRRFDSDPRLQYLQDPWMGAAVSRLSVCPDGEMGRHKGLKIPWPQGRGGSNPPPGTNQR